jgi:hypothetical protein
MLVGPLEWGDWLLESVCLSLSCLWVVWVLYALVLEEDWLFWRWVYRFVLLRMIVFLIHWVLDSFLMCLTGIWASGTFPVFTLGTYWRCSECGEGEFNFNSC